MIRNRYRVNSHHVWPALALSLLSNLGCGTVVGNGQHITGDETKRRKKKSTEISGDATQTSDENRPSTSDPVSKGSPAFEEMSEQNRGTKILADWIRPVFASGCDNLFEKSSTLDHFALKFDAEQSAVDDQIELVADSRLLFLKSESGWTATVHFNDESLKSAIEHGSPSYPNIQFDINSGTVFFHPTAGAEPEQTTANCQLTEAKSDVVVSGLNGWWQVDHLNVESSEQNGIDQLTWTYRMDLQSVSEIGALQIRREETRIVFGSN